MGDFEAVTIRVISSMDEISATDWNACANPGGSQGPPEYPYNPFISHDFLQALEESGCVRADTGWLPRHLIAEDNAGQVAACMPCYAKGHSQGEYVFDHGWADAYERAGGRYYPKLQCSVPFTPVPGRRLLVRAGLDAAHFQHALGQAGMELAARNELSSLHVTFASEKECQRLRELGFLHRTGQQFHWHNEEYADFDDFLSRLASRKRKAIRRERRQAIEHGIGIRCLTGREITEAHWDSFFAFYMDTGSRKWGRPYLNRDFFSLLGERMSGDILLIVASREGRDIAGALNLIGSDTLYGRYWGTVEDHPCLHFEICYYQAIEFAISRGLARVEAGAQGPHKLARGYVPQVTHSAHYIADPALRDAIARFLVEEDRQLQFENRLLAAHAPFRHDSSE
jgi:hypothetical protein